jgi:hypothetical protein
MNHDGIGLELLGLRRADVYVAGADESQTAWRLVRTLDENVLRAVAAPADVRADRQPTRHVMDGCSGAVAVLAVSETPERVEPAVLREVRQATQLRLPLALLGKDAVLVGAQDVVLHVGAADPIPIPDPSNVQFFEDDAHSASVWLHSRICGVREPSLPYAFFVGRLERDFSHAREAIRVAVESEAGIPCLWSDDGRHRTNVASVRERTRLLIREACFIIADLTLGPESPERENPSRAHEVGMAIGYDREIMLCSQEPRRYPYFSIADMQMSFWNTESELAAGVADWIRTTPGVFRQRVLNHELPERDHTYHPRIVKPGFRYDPAHRFVGPTHAAARSPGRRRWRSGSGPG